MTKWIFQQVEAYSKIGKTQAEYAFIFTDLGAKYKFLLSMLRMFVALLHLSLTCCPKVSFLSNQFQVEPDPLIDL